MQRAYHIICISDWRHDDVSRVGLGEEEFDNLHARLQGRNANCILILISS